MLNVWHSWMNAWRWRFGSSLLVKGECCTMRIVEVLISNGLPISVRFKIGRSTMSGVRSSPILHSCGWSPIGGSRFSRGLWGGEFFGDSNDPSSSDFESTKFSFLACCASCLLSLESFLDHLQNYWVCWRGCCPSPVRVSDKQNIKNKKVKTNLKN
jgi:hypothetical protein